MRCLLASVLTAGGLVGSNLVLNLNGPNKLGDVSWYTPSKYVGIWWELHLENSSWATGKTQGATTANTRRPVDPLHAKAVTGRRDKAGIGFAHWPLFVAFAEFYQHAARRWLTRSASVCGTWRR